jgi:hypothetical protein
MELSVFRFNNPIVALINIGGVVLGVYWFGWWFLLPLFLAAIRYKKIS